MPRLAIHLASTLLAMSNYTWAQVETSVPIAMKPANEQTRLVINSCNVAPVWSGHPVQFAILTHGNDQFVAFYDAERTMTVGRRTIDSCHWEFKRLPEKIGWDSHNYITLALDADKCLHVSGNMHGDPLVYFRSSQPLDIASLDRVTSMTGLREQKCTYPEFIQGPQDQLIFTYRDGGSGNGDQLFNVYDTSTRQWRRLLEQPLASGEGAMNAYFHGPVKGPDGYFHLCWVWRDTPDCATNHDLSYARSRDLVNWETSNGKPLTLPMKISTAEIVDPVPPGGGIINGNTVIGFDNADRPVITYHKYDTHGNTQIYLARPQDDKWQITQCSNWDYRWEFSGGGTIGFEVGVTPVQPLGGDRLLLYASNRRNGPVGWILDNTTLKPTATAPPRPKVSPSKWRTLEAKFRGMKINWATDPGSSATPLDESKPDVDGKYILRWETLTANRDKPHPPPLPPPTMLRVLELGDADTMNYHK